MGYSGKLQEKEEAQRLREEGLSYKEILKQINVSKDTISRWCRDIVLTPEQKERLLKNKSFGQRKGSIIAAENKRQNRLNRTKQIFECAKKDIGVITDHDQFFIGIALYVAEGSKTGNHIGFSNSDPRLIKFMMKWFLKFTKLSILRFRGALWLHEGLSEKKAKEFWSQLTKIPISQFHKTYVAENKTSSKKIRKNIHEFGVFSIRCSDSAAHRMILGWISALFSDRIIQHSVIAQW